MPPNRLPNSERVWEERANAEGVLNESIHVQTDVNPASKIDMKQYLALRALWINHGSTAARLKTLDFRDNDALFDEARAYVEQKDTPWEKYLDHLKDLPASPQNEIKDIGPFSLVHYTQQRVKWSTDHRTEDQKSLDLVDSKFSPRKTRSATLAPAQANPPSTPSRVTQLADDFNESLNIGEGTSIMGSPQTPATSATSSPVDDEQIVNNCLILFLNSLIIFCPKIKGLPFGTVEWTEKRLKLDFGDWEARTDGYLRIRKQIRLSWKSNPIPVGISWLRYRDKRPLKWQRGSVTIQTMVFTKGRVVDVSYKEHHADKVRRLLISQDSFEIYFTVAEFEAAYADYICNENESAETKRAFMTMNQYGPWNTLNCNNMRHLGRLLLGFTLQQLSP